MDNYRTVGLSIIELLTALAIIAIMLTLAAPPLQDFITRNKVTGQLNQLVKIIHMARETAIFLNRTVIICPTIHGRSCNGDWHQGILLFTDTDGNKQPNSTADIIYHLAALNDDDRVYWRAFRSRQFLEMRPVGFTAWQNGTLTYCPAEGLAHARGIILNAAGRIRLTVDANNDGIHEGASGRPLRCE